MRQSRASPRLPSISSVLGLLSASIVCLCGGALLAAANAGLARLALAGGGFAAYVYLFARAMRTVFDGPLMKRDEFLVGLGTVATLSEKETSCPTPLSSSSPPPSSSRRSGTRSAAKTCEAPVNFETILGLFLAAAALVYLLYALLHPEDL
ncbi:MAG: potassium-transporting ATPase subunit F [Thermoanaerobaculia bacterium]